MLLLSGALCWLRNKPDKGRKRAEPVSELEGRRGDLDYGLNLQCAFAQSSMCFGRTSEKLLTGGQLDALSLDNAHR